MFYRKEFNEWTPRIKGQAQAPVLVKTHPTRAILQDCDEEEWPPVLPDGNEIVETDNFFGMIFIPGSEKRPMRVFIPFMRTQLKKARRWITKASSYVVDGPDGTSFQAPLFYKAYSLGNVHETNASGNWFGFRVQVEYGLEELAVKLSLIHI